MKTKKYYEDQVRRSIKSFVEVAKGEYDYYECTDHGTIDFGVFARMIKIIAEFKTADPEGCDDYLKRLFGAFSLSEREVEECKAGNKETFVKAWNRSKGEIWGHRVQITPSMVSFRNCGRYYDAVIDAFGTRFPIYYDEFSITI